MGVGRDGSVNARYAGTGHHAAFASIHSEASSAYCRLRLGARERPAAGVHTRRTGCTERCLCDGVPVRLYQACIGPMVIGLWRLRWGYATAAGVAAARRALPNGEGVALHFLWP